MKLLNKKNIFSVLSRIFLVTHAWKTRQKIVVIESDDWGAIRTSNKEALIFLQQNGYEVARSPYSYDTIESNEDLELLYAQLKKYEDRLGNSPCFTANVVLANPDFEKIKASAYTEYHFERIEETIKNYPNSSRVIDLWKQGHQDKIFYPQVHAREHVKYWKWLTDLQNNVSEAVHTFPLGMCGVPRSVSKTGTSYYTPLYIDDKALLNHQIDQQKMIRDAFTLFEDLFGFSSKTTIAPNCGWTDTTERVWSQNGVQYIQGGFLQEHHRESAVNYIPHYLGQKSKNNGLIYLVRNCTFEPARSNNEHYWRQTLREVTRAFHLHTPAIISTHRVNYVGAVNSGMRENSLKQLESLLTAIHKKWPEVIFLNSKQLGNLINESHK